MVRSTGGRCRLSRCHRRWTPYPIPLSRYASERREWEETKCSVCLEFPHNAILLLCSSHDKGCRPYMCGTGFRYSNCLDLFKKAYSKEATLSPAPHESVLSLSWPACKKFEMELCCPLCRGQVKGWTVVEPAREYLNKKKRGCMQDSCSFVGTYKRLKKHVMTEHRRAKPREVDPALKEKWKALELQRERQDVISTIRSSMPRSVVLGDYVIDMGSNDFDTDDDEDGEYDDDYDDDDGDDDGEGFGGERGNSGRISRRILYSLFRESARFMRFQRGNAISEDGEEGDGGGAAGVYPLEMEEDYGDGGRSRGRIMNLMRAERGQERRQATRGRREKPQAIRDRGRSVSGVSGRRN